MDCPRLRVASTPLLCLCIIMFHSVVLHYDVPQCGALLCGFVQYRVACFCVVLYNVLCGVVHSWPELATQLSLNYQIIPHIPRDHTGHLSLQAHS